MRIAVLLVVLVIVAACGGQPKESRPIPAVSQTPGAGDCLETPEPTPLQCTAASELARLRILAKNDPAGALLALGLRDSEFAWFARTAYGYWQTKNPAQPKTTTAPQPTAPASTTQQGDSDRRWWCYTQRESDFGYCMETKTECDRIRSDNLKRKTSAPCGYPLTEKDCLDLIAKFDGIYECKRQDRAACFEKHYVLENEDSLACAPSISSCKRRLEYVKGQMGEDMKVTSPCKAVD